MNSGKKGEDMACAFLLRQGLILLDRNYRLPFGEVDLIMRDKDTVVFVEVKYRSSERYGSTLEVVTPHKQHKIKLVAGAYLQCHSEIPLVRFDVVGINPQGSSYIFKWVKGAFE